jgi:exonuclease VII large subunit
MFKGRNSYVDFIPREGDNIEARATVTLYEARGDFQLTVEFLQQAGLGALFEAFEKLKAKVKERINVLKVLSYDKSWSLNITFLLSI